MTMINVWSYIYVPEVAMHLASITWNTSRTPLVLFQQQWTVFHKNHNMSDNELMAVAAG